MCESSKHIAFFVPSLRGGGAEQVILNLSEHFAKSGASVDLVLAKKEGPYCARISSNVKVVDLEACRVLGSLLPLISYLRRERPDVMLSTLDHANLVLLWSKKLANVSTRTIVRVANTLSVSTSQSASWRDQFITILAKHFYPWANGIVAVSRGVGDDLSYITKIPRESINVINNPVPIEELELLAEEDISHEWFVDNKLPIVLGVGRLVKQKGFSTLIRAFAEVVKIKSCRLVIIGEGGLRVDLERLVNSLGLEEVVLLPGFATNPFPYMAQASVFVLSSEWEGFPNVLLQAMALGTPVVSTDCKSGPSEIITCDELGSLVPVGDIISLRDAILSRLNSSRDISRGRNAIAKNFSCDKICSDYSNYIDMVLSG